MFAPPASFIVTSMSTTKIPRKSISKSRKKPPSKDSSGDLVIKVALDPTDETLTYYTNHVEVAHSRHEFSLIAARLPGKLSVAARLNAEETQELVLEPELQLLIAPTLMPALIKALQSQYAVWHEKFGKPEEE